MQRAHLSSVFFGGVEVDALALRRALKLGSYRFNFDTGPQELTISSNKGEIMRIECLYESARKFVTEFGCKHASETCTAWAISIPKPILYSNGSEYARAIEQALRRSGLPFEVHAPNEQEGLSMVMLNTRFTPKSEAEVLEVVGTIEDQGVMYADVIALWKT